MGLFFLIAIFILLVVAIGILIFIAIKVDGLKKGDSNEQDEKIKQQIFDGLVSMKADIESTV